MVASRKASRSLRSSPTNRSSSIRRAAAQALHGRALVDRDRRAHLEHHAAEVVGEARPLQLGRDLRLQVAAGVVGAGRVAVVDREGDALVLDVAAQLRQEAVVLARPGAHRGSPAGTWPPAAPGARRRRATPPGRGCPRSRPPRAARACAPRPPAGRSRRPRAHSASSAARAPPAPRAARGPPRARPRSGRACRRCRTPPPPGAGAPEAAPPSGPGCRPRRLQYPPCRAEPWPGGHWTGGGVLLGRARCRRRHRDRAPARRRRRATRPRPPWRPHWRRSCSQPSPPRPRTPRRGTSTGATRR